MPDEASEALSSKLADEEIAAFKFQPFKHQIEAIEYGLSHEKWLLLDSMGLGKSLESMYLAEALHARGLVSKCLVICGVDSLRSNWKAEIEKFSKLPCCVLGEYKTKSGKSAYRSVKERCEQLRKPMSEFFVIVNAATVGFDEFVEAYKKSENDFGMIILDEAHRFATKSSNRGSNLLKMDARYKVALTGTPITNSPISAYVMLSWTGNDHATLTNYKAQYCEFGGFNDAQIIGYKHLDLLREEIAACSVRRTFDQVRGDMPAKTIDFESVEMPEKQAKFYDAIKNGVKEEADKIELSSSNLLALTTRLRQATAAPSVLTSEDIGSCKVERAAQLAEDLLEAGEKVIIFSTFVEPTLDLMARLERFHPLLATGAISDDEVQRNIRDFREKDSCSLLIGTHGKLGTGYSMPECHYSIMLDFPWTYYALSQSADRIYRITSDQPVYIKCLMAKGTIDERVRDVVEKKKDLQDYLVDGKEGKMSDSLKDEMMKIIKEL